MQNTPDGRATWAETFMEMAKVLARMRGDCTRNKVAAIIFDPSNGDLIQPGYNGAPAGQLGCLQGACPRGRHYPQLQVKWAQDACKADPYTPPHVLVQLTKKTCACGGAWPCPDYVESGSSYDTGPGTCTAVHAEANALLRAGKAARGMSMVVTAEPCEGCVKLIRGARISRVITPTAEFSWLRGHQDQVRGVRLVRHGRGSREGHLAGS